MKSQPVKGTRDFYPDQMAVRNWLTDAWRRVSLRNGFAEFDGPVLEYLDLYRAKSGDEIVSQLFAFTDRGGRELALRPEITPTLARMVNARINSLPRPIKWFSIPRLWRAENPQKGRLREFFQWNIDVIGSDDVLADAECIFTAVDFLQEAGLGPEDVTVRIGSRPLTTMALRMAGLEDSQMEAALAALDKRPRVEAKEFQRLAAGAGIPGDGLGRLCDFQDAPDLEAAAGALGGGEQVRRETAALRSLLDYLSAMGAGDYCKLDLRMVRGLAYYTGIVYEIFDASGSMRAIAGGGRYDDLLKVLGGPKVGATGFGMGDPVLGILLEEKGKLPDLAAGLECFVVPAEENLTGKVLTIVGRLRRGGISADFSVNPNLAKSLKEANRRGARYALIAGGSRLGVKDLATGQQVETTAEQFLADPRKYVSPASDGHAHRP